MLSRRRRRISKRHCLRCLFTILRTSKVMLLARQRTRFCIFISYGNRSCCSCIDSRCLRRQVADHRRICHMTSSQSLLALRSTPRTKSRCSSTKPWITTSSHHLQATRPSSLRPSMFMACSRRTQSWKRNRRSIWHTMSST